MQLLQMLTTPAIPGTEGQLVAEEAAFHFITHRLK